MNFYFILIYEKHGFMASNCAITCVCIQVQGCRYYSERRLHSFIASVLRCASCAQLARCNATIMAIKSVDMFITSFLFITLWVQLLCTFAMPQHGKQKTNEKKNTAMTAGCIHRQPSMLDIGHTHTNIRERRTQKYYANNVNVGRVKKHLLKRRCKDMERGGGWEKLS